MEKIEKENSNLTTSNVEIIKDLFPQAFSDGEINKDILLAILGIDETSKEEMYHFGWKGKQETIKFSQSPSSGTLIPQKEKSVNWEETDNLYIEGDNVEVLKILQKTYHGKIKMIYIDPPYNTGEDFIYKDDFSNNIENYKELTNQKGKTNPETSGRFHTDWLNMIYPRLKLAHNLLKDEGVIFISIDDHEVSNLRKVCDEIFGDYNFITQFIWQNKKGGGNDSVHVAIEHEYVLVYAKNKDQLAAFYESYSDEYLKRYKEKDDEGRFFWDTFKRKSGKQYYPITCPDGTVLQYDVDGNPISWLRSKERFESDILKGDIRIIKINDKWSVQFKQRMPEGKKPRSIINVSQVIQDKGTTSTGSDDVYDYFKKDVFSNPKPVALIEYFLEFGMSSDDIVMDFFSGSGTIAEAVMRANSKDGGKRKYIAVQLNEEIIEPEKVANANAKRINENAINVLNSLGYEKVITNLAEERIRRAGKKIYNELKQKKDSAGLFADTVVDPDSLDFGFKVFKLDSTCIKPWDPTIKHDENSIFDLLDVVKEDRTNLDVAYEVMLKYGVFNMPLEEIQVNGKTVYSVGRGYMIISLNNEITPEDVEAIAKLQPKAVVFKESGFVDDNAKINADYTFKRMGIDNVKCI